MSEKTTEKKQMYVLRAVPIEEKDLVVGDIISCTNDGKGEFAAIIDEDDSLGDEIIFEGNEIPRLYADLPADEQADA